MSSVHTAWLRLPGKQAPHPLYFSVVLLDVGDYLLSLRISVKVGFYQSNNQGIRAELNISDFFNISSLSLCG